MKEVILEKMTFNFDDNNLRNRMSNYIIDLLKKEKSVVDRTIIILCIGSDRYIGDALGPLVGSYLEEHVNCIVYGSLDKPVHAGNLVEVIQRIDQQYYQPFVIAVDACLGKGNEIGNVEIWKGSLAAGIAVGASLPCVGDISIIGVVNASSYIGYLDLQNTPLSIVMKLSKGIGGALCDVINELQIVKEKTDHPIRRKNK